MAENAAKSGAIVGSGANGGGGGGDDPPRKSNMNGNRSGRFGMDPVGKGRGSAGQKSPSDSADEESKLLQQGGGKATQVVKGSAGGGTDVDSGGGMEEGENGDLVNARDGHGVSVIDMAEGGGQPYKPAKSKKTNVFKGKKGLRIIIVYLLMIYCRSLSPYVMFLRNFSVLFSDS